MAFQRERCGQSRQLTSNGDIIRFMTEIQPAPDFRELAWRKDSFSSRIPALHMPLKLKI